MDGLMTITQHCMDAQCTIQLLTMAQRFMEGPILTFCGKVPVSAEAQPLAVVPRFQAGPLCLPKILQGEPGVVATLDATAVANAKCTACVEHRGTGFNTTSPSEWVGMLVNKQ